MCKFVVKDILFAVNCEALSGGVNQYEDFISLKLYPSEYSDFPKSMHMLQNITPGSVVEISTSTYMEWIYMFENEFKQFLLENHPEKIITNQKAFIEMFGDIETNQH